MITTQKITNDAYVITVDGEKSIAAMKELIENALDFGFFDGRKPTDELCGLLNKLFDDSWRQDSPT